MKSFFVKRKKVAIFVTLLLITLAIVIPKTFATNEVDKDSVITGSQIELGMSENIETEAEPSKEDVLVSIYDKGSIEDNNLQIILDVTDDVYQIKMIAPPKQLESRAFSSPLTLGESATEDEIVVVKNVLPKNPKIQKAFLGLSSPETTDSGGATSEETVNSVAFDVNTNGDYRFELIGQNSEILKIVPYGLRSGTYVNLDYFTDISDGKKDFYKFYGSVNFDFKYTPKDHINGETVRLILPPFMEIGTTPNSSPGNYTVTSSLISLPAEHYNNPNDSILLNYMNDNNLQVREIVFEFAPTFSETFTYSSHIYNNDDRKPDYPYYQHKYKEIEELMILYGTDYDKVPFKMIAEAYFTDSKTPIEKDYLLGDSTIKDIEGTPIAENFSFGTGYPKSLEPHYDFLHGQPYMVTTFPATAHSYGLHYPITDIEYYYKKLDNNLDIEDKPLASYNILPVLEEVTIDGQEGYKYKDNQRINLGYSVPYTIESVISIDPADFRVKLPNPKDDLVPGTKYKQIEIMVKYKYKGQSFEQPLYKVDDYEIPNHYLDGPEELKTGIQWNGSDGGDSIVRYQGTDGDLYGFSMQRSISSYNDTIYPSISDLTIKSEFPYEYSPTELTTLKVGVFEDDDDDLKSSGVAPTKITYKFHGDSTVYEAMPSEYGRTIPGTPTKRVSEILYYYEKLPASKWAQDYGYREILAIFKSNVLTVDSAGNPLPDSYDTNIKFTANFDYNKRKPDGTSYKESKEFIRDIKLTLVKPVGVINYPEDSLRFNNLADSRNNDKYLTYEYAAFEAGEVYGEYSPYPVSGWGFGFKASSPLMIDYSDVKIKINNDTDDEKKAVSIMGGIYYNVGNHVSDGFEKFDVFYTTNLNSTPRKAVIGTFGYYSREYYKFELADGEYPTGIEISLGTLRGGVYSTLNDYSLADYADSIESNAVYRMIQPLYRDVRYFFKGSSSQELIADRTTLNVSATVSTSTPAKHINNQQPGEYFNDTAKGKITIKTLGYGTYRVDPSTSYWNVPNRSYNQGDIAKISYYIRQLLEGDPDRPRPCTYDTNIYVEVDENFELIKFGKDTLVSVKELPATKSRLYVFKARVEGNSYNGHDVSMEYYIRPDTPVIAGEYRVIKKIGFAMDNLISQYLSPETGDNAYYTKAPYAKFGYTTQPFPAAWGASDTFYVDATSDYTRQGLKISRADFVDIKMNPMVNGGVKTGKAEFTEGDKDNLGVIAYLRAGAAATLSKYEAEFSIPTAGEATANMTETSVENLLNEDTLYLSGVPYFERDTPTDNLKFIYYDENGLDITSTLSNPPTANELEQVRHFEVSFENFAPGTSYPIVIPLKSKTFKTGADVADKPAFVGGKFRANGFGTYTIVGAAEFAYSSYHLDMRLGVDRTESGSFGQLLADGIVDVKVYYNGSNTPIYDSDKGGEIVPKINTDASKVVVNIKPEYRDIFRLSLQLGDRSDLRNSDFPIIGGNFYKSELDISAADLINNRKNLYDLNLLPYTEIKVNDLSTYYKLKDIETPMSVNIVYKDNQQTIANRLRDKYTDPKLNIVDKTIADYNGVIKKDYKTYLSGYKADEETDYTLTMKNAFGETVTSNVAKIKVGLVYASGWLDLSMQYGSLRLDPSDSMTYSNWRIGNESGKFTDTTILPENAWDGWGMYYVTIYGAAVGKKNYFEANLPEGYDIEKFEIAHVTGYNGKPENTPLTFTLESESNGVKLYSYVLADIPSDVTTGIPSRLEGTIYIENTNLEMKLKKDYKPSSILVDPDKLYDITITDNFYGNQVVYNGSIKVGDIAEIDAIRYGHTYTIKETATTGYELNSFKTYKADNQETSIVPVKIDDLQYKISPKMEFKKGTIVLENTIINGGGINLSKAADSRGLNGEEFAFKLVGGLNGPNDPGKKVEVYGFADFSSSDNTPEMTVTWYTKPDKTDPQAKQVDVTSLPVGQYSLTEVAQTGKTNFVFSDFEFTSPNITKNGNELLITVQKSQPSAMDIKAVNNIKSGGTLKVKLEFDNGYYIDNSNFNFEITNPPLNNAPTASTTFTLGDKTTLEYTQTGLSYGKYGLELKALGIENYEIVSFEIDKANSKTFALPVTVANNLRFDIGEFTNQYKEVTVIAKLKVKSDGVINISKEVSGINTMPNHIFEFKVTDMFGKSQTVELKAGETKTIDGLIRGKYTVEETTYDDFNHKGFSVNNGAITSTTTATLNLVNPNESQTIKSTSTIKNDAQIIIGLDFVKTEQKPDSYEEFRFQLYRSINGGPWEIPSEPGFDMISLKLDENHTFSNLIRGAEYKVAASNSPLFPFEVRTITINNGTAGEVLNNKELVFKPVKGALISDATFILDIKRVDLTIDKYAFLPVRNTGNSVSMNPSGEVTYGSELRNIKLYGAEFTLYRYDNEGNLHTLPKWKQITDNDGKTIFGGLAAGKYKIVESKPPAFYKTMNGGYFNFEVHKNEVTGDLFVFTENLPDHVYANENTLSIPNKPVDDDSNYSDNGKIDSNKPLVTEEVEPEIEPQDNLINNMPETGGFPIVILAVVGGVLFVIGWILKKKDKN